MHLYCSFRAELNREYYFSYILGYDVEIKVEVVDVNEDGAETGGEYLVGRASVDKLLWQTAQIDGESLSDICDEDSAGWYDVHRAITSRRDPQDLRDELGVAEGVSEVLFLHRASLSSCQC